MKLHIQGVWQNRFLGNWLMEEKKKKKKKFITRT